VSACSHLVSTIHFKGYESIFERTQVDSNCNPKNRGTNLRFAFALERLVDVWLASIVSSWPAIVARRCWCSNVISTANLVQDKGMPRTKPIFRARRGGGRSYFDRISFGSLVSAQSRARPTHFRDLSSSLIQRRRHPPNPGAFSCASGCRVPSVVETPGRSCPSD
jgi:hypothetical protein